MKNNEVLNKAWVYNSLKLDTEGISQSLLNIEEKERSNLFAWNGQFSPQLIETLLSQYAPEKGTILDPFAGSGTVLYEAGCLKLTAYGTEINPAAYKLAKIYKLMNIGKKDREQLLLRIESTVSNIADSVTNAPPDVIDKKLKKSLVDSLPNLNKGFERDIMKALIILLDFYKNDISIKKVYDKFAKLKKIISNMSYTRKKIEVWNSDARTIPLKDNSIDVVITSPPYINVFNYHQNYRASVEALGWDILSVAKSEIGSNRKNRGNRILTVIQYCIEMAQCLNEMKRVLKESGQIIMIVGRESTIRKTPFYNAQLISEIGTQAVDLKLNKRQERVFKNKFGSLIYEDILYFSMQSNSVLSGDILKKSRTIAEDALIQALSYAPEESIKDINSALEKIQDIEASPLYSLTGDKNGISDPAL